MWAVQAFKNTILITSLVMIMMMLIEYVNIASHGRAIEQLKHRPFLQVVLCALLGFVPGCAGGFIVVSLYAHGMVSFGALLAMLITTIGDDGFFLLAMDPSRAVAVSLVLLAIGIAVGFLADAMHLQVARPFDVTHFPVHEHDSAHGTWGKLKDNFRQVSKQRMIILTGLLIFCICVVSGLIGHTHEAGHGLEQAAHHHDEHNFFEEHAVNYLFGFLGLLTAFFVAKSNKHFVKEHLWNHIIRHHFLKIFCWTLGILIVVGLIEQYVDIDAYLQGRGLWMALGIAILLGLTPTSGPNMLVISLFVTGHLPLGILMANSMVQDGHASLPLLAETGKGFVISKAVKVILAVCAFLCCQFLYP